MIRWTNARRVGKDGPVVVDFVDDDMQRRTVVVPFSLSGIDQLPGIVEHVNAALPMIPHNLDDGTED